MPASTLADLEVRLRRLERQNRFLLVLLCAGLAVGSIAASSAQSTVLTATEVRAQRFTLLDPNGGVADDWYIFPTRDAGGLSHGERSAPYSGWGFSKP